MEPGDSCKSLSETALLNDLRRGNARAFDRVFCNYYTNLCRYAYTLVQDEDMSQSLVQAVFVKLWENRGSMGHVENLPAYLTTMVRNHCINFLNREKKIVRLKHLPVDTQTDNGTEDLIQKNDFEEKLFTAVASMTGRCKAAFEYSRFEHLTNREIADKMGITVKGVEALIGRALKFLRESLSEYLPGNTEAEEKKKKDAKARKKFKES